MPIPIPILPSAVLELLACPVCHGSLVERLPAAIVCNLCRRAYPVRDGIPVLIAEASRLDEEQAQ
jgi:uncharacterized protein YbaR (Trm112 family)